MKVLFTYLVAFSGNGGIQKFNRCFINALYDLHKDNKISLSISSPYDSNIDNRYVSKELFKAGFNKTFFALYTLINAFRYDVIILGHINLAGIGYLIKVLFPKKKIILIAHGIEVWRPLTFLGRKLLLRCDKVLAVSQFTKDVLVKTQEVNPEKIFIFHNTIDPYLEYPVAFKKPKYLLDRYGIRSTDKVIITVARLSATEQYKGYDQVIDALGQIRDPNIIYLIGGKYDAEEKQRLQLIIQMNHLDNHVFLIGYVNDFELTDHYLMADLFIMPSKKEGFGIVFIEAMACGLKVIAGNKDGSVDALKNGELGYLIDPDNNREIQKAIVKALEDPLKDIHKTVLQQKVIEYFGYEAYKKRLTTVLDNI